MQKPLLEVRDLSLDFRVFKGILKVLDRVNFRVGPKEKVGLVGESGCGKSTLLRAITMSFPINTTSILKGEILFKGRNILKMDKAEVQEIRRKEISIVFQDPVAALNPVFSIGSQIKAIIKYSLGREKNLTKAEIKACAIEGLRKVMIPDPARILKNYPIQLSGGMCQRICIAMALLSSLSLIVADEPGTNLDATINEEVLRLLDNRVEEKGISIVLVSHDLGIVKNITNRTYIMYSGNIVEVEKTKELFTNPLHPYSQGLVACVPKLTGEGIPKEIPGNIVNYFNPPKGCRFYPRCIYKMPICKVKRPPLFKVGETHRVACWLYKKGRD